MRDKQQKQRNAIKNTNEYKIFILLFKSLGFRVQWKTRFNTTANKYSIAYKP